MTTVPRKFYITTAIDYVNSLPHIGTAYEKIGADALARFRRREGDEVHFQMGNDEHSHNVHKAARAKGQDPKAYCDQMRKHFESIWQQLEISYDGFIQTSEDRHRVAVQSLFQTIYDKGDIYQGHYEGWYCNSCEAFYMEKDLVDGHCPHHKAKPEWLHEENYFFRLSKFQEPLLEHYRKHPEFILPAVRRNEIIRLVESGLDDISVSRANVPWGIPLPINETEIIYVWFDALINYLTAIGFPNDQDNVKKWWPADVHVIGKDITRFHCVIWPSMLMSAGLELPKTVFGHGFVYLKGEKMSKTLGNIITPLDVIPKYGADSLRYYLLATSSFGADGDFTWDGFIQRYNADLANDLGNVLNRTVGMAFKYQGGQVSGLRSQVKTEDQELREKFQVTLAKIRECMDPLRGDIRTHEALSAIWNFLGAVDKYIDNSAPWALHKKGEHDRVNDVLNQVTAALRLAALLLHPFLPQPAINIWKRLGLSEQEDFDSIRYPDLNWDDMPTPLQLQQGTPLFPRIEEEADETKGKAMEATAANKAPEKKTEDNQISIDDFAKVELRVAKILAAEKVEGANRLLKLQIDLGTEQRQLVAGIAQSYEPETLVGKQVVVVANLKPATIRGVESNGMLLAASGPNGAIILTPEQEAPLGAKVK